MELKFVLELATDVAQNRINPQYTKDEASKTLRQAIIDANGGSTKIDHRSFQRYPELYDLIEKVLPILVQEGYKGDEFFTDFIDYRNIAQGDDRQFWTEDESLFLISEMAEGNMSIRRQRLNAGSYTTLARSLKGVRIYEELNRLTTGRVDFNVFIDRLGKSYNNRVYTDIYGAFNGISSSTTNMGATYYKTGSFAEDTLVTLIDHVEAAMGSTAKIVGPRSALRKITTAILSEKSKEDMNLLGYYGNFNGTPMIMAKQRHAIGGSSFLLDDSKVYVVAGGEIY